MRPEKMRVAGYFEEEAPAEAAAQELADRGIPTRIASGVEIAESHFGGQLARGLLTGAAIAVPFAIILPLAGWLYRHTGASPLDAIAWLSLPIIFVGAFLGAVVAAARHETSRRAHSRVVVTPPSLDDRSAGHAAATIEEAGGEVVQRPPERRGELAD